MINPIKFCVYAAGKPLRYLLLRDHRLARLLDLSQCDDIFPDPSTYPCILVITCGGGHEDWEVQMGRPGARSSKPFVDALTSDAHTGLLRVTAGSILRKQDAIISVAASSSAEDCLLEKMSASAVNLGEHFNVEQAIRIGGKLKRQKLVLTADAMEKLPEQRRSLCRPVLDGSDLQRYEISWPCLFLVYDTKQLYNWSFAKWRFTYPLYTYFLGCGPYFFWCNNPWPSPFCKTPVITRVLQTTD
jgi:hypothetical protein